MNPTGLEPLKGLTLPIVVPKALPAGFVLKSARPTSEFDEESYQVEWSSGESTLIILGTSGGIGDRLPGERSFQFQHPTFGQVQIEVEEDQLATGWMSEMSDGLPAYCLVGREMQEQQFLEIASSLDYLKL